MGWGNVQLHYVITTCPAVSLPREKGGIIFNVVLSAIVFSVIALTCMYGMYRISWNKHRPPINVTQIPRLGEIYAAFQ